MAKFKSEAEQEEMAKSEAEVPPPAPPSELVIATFEPTSDHGKFHAAAVVKGLSQLNVKADIRDGKIVVLSA